MSNKIALATIQFRADAKGANVALESLRQSSKNAHDEIDRMQKALNNGVKTMKDANGVDFDVAKRLRDVTKEAKGFDQAIRELVKGASALETVVKNIRLGEIEASSRAELKGAINAAEARKRSVRQTDPEDLQQQRELNQVIEESRKQLNNLDRDTQKVLETLDKGGTVAQSVLDKEMKGLREMLTLIPKGTEEWQKYNTQLQQIETHVANIRRQEREQASSLLGSGNLGQYSEEQIRTAIANAKELLSTYKTASPEAKALADNIARADQYLKEHGVEAARAAAREAEQLRLEKELATTMNKRLRDLKSLSADALAETRRYWETQRNGAAEGTAEFNKAEKALKSIDNLQKRRKVSELDAILGDPKKFGVAEVKNAIQEMERLRDSVQKGIPAWKHYNKMVNDGKAYLDQLSKSEAAKRINTQMQSLSTLSASGLQEVKRYWEAMVSGAAHGSAELDTYRQKLEQVMAEEKARSAAAAQQRTTVLGGNLGQFSEAEIRQAIEAGKQLIQTYNTADPAAKKLAEDIVRAEEHLKQYGVEAERTAQREKRAVEEAARERQKADQLMQDQLRQGAALSQTALRQQEQYWQRLIDDPKTASTSLQQYKNNLEQVRQLQTQMVQTKGKDALAFFRGDTSNASVSQTQEQAAALKKYRDSLPKKDNADLIREIDELLVKAGAAAQKASEQAMSLKEALQIGATAGKNNFRGTTEQLVNAKKVLEEYQQKVQKGSAAWKNMQDNISRIELELKNVGHISSDIQAVLDRPKGRSFNELKQAVEQGRKALANMRTDTKEGQKAFDELAAKVKEADLQMKNLGNSSKGTASAFDKAWSRLKTYITLYVGAAVAMQKLTAAMGDLMELSDKMGEVQKTTAFTAEEVGHLTNELRKMDTRTAITGLLDLSVAAGQLGLKTQEDVLGFTEAANKLMVALPEMGKEGATEMLKVALATGEIDKIRKQMEQGLIDGSSATAVAMDKVGSTIDRLRATSAATAPAITDFVKRVGAVGAQSGITIDQVAALGSTVDALGMRVEMSATALSRMLPAIKNNAFALAQAIGVTPDTIRSLFDAGRGMEVVLMVLQRIKDSGMDADSIENMLGMAGMKDIMKDLNQQGARAGIVFAGLSQNVDTLRKHLVTAREAYEENTAITKEYDKMNQTTAARWERLKNQVEETFVSDSAQRSLGWIIDRLRDLVDLLTGSSGVSVALQTILIYLGLVRLRLISIAAGALTKVGAGLKNIGIMLGFIKGEMTKLQLSNIFTAAAGAVLYLATTFRDAAEAVSAVSKAMGDIEKEMQKEMATADMLFHSLAKAREQEHLAAASAMEQAEAEARKAEVTERSVAATDNYINKLSLVDMLENQRAETEKLFTDNLKKRVKTADDTARAEEAAAEATSKMAEAGKSLAIQSALIKTLEEQRVSVESVLMGAIKKVAETTEQAAAADGKLSEESRKVAEQSAKVEEGMHRVNVEGSKSASIIREINSKYSTYLGYMLSETSSAEQLAKARELINAKLRETITLKQQEAAMGNVEQQYGGNVNKRASKMDKKIQELFGDNYDAAARVSVAISEAAQKYAKNTDQYEKAVQKIVADNFKYIENEQVLKQFSASVRQDRITGMILDAADDYREAVEEYQDQTDVVNRRFEATMNVNRKTSREAITKDLNAILGDWKDLVSQYQKAEGEEKEKLAAAVYKQQRAYANAVANNAEYFAQDKRMNAFEKNIKNMATWEKGLRDVAGEAIRTIDAMERAETKVTNLDFTNNGNSANNPWGTPLSGESTDWKNMTAEQLVNRRKQMNQFVNAIQTDTDVQSVLNEDAALKKAIEKGMASDMRTVIEWYNTERLKIQDELHARHLTNTGDWMDPKKEKARKKQFESELIAYLDELDAYYTERKTRIQEAGTEEGITEAEVRNRTLANEMEWRQRRAELQKLYADKSAEVTAEEQDAIFDIIAERTGDSSKFIEKTIRKTVQFSHQVRDMNEQGAKEYRKWMGKLGLGWERDFLKQQQALSQQMKAIQDIIDKERPFNGITKNLRENLVTMGILTADMSKERDELMRKGEDMADFNARQAAEELRRTAFMLGEAESVYSATMEDVMRRMADAGLEAWADELRRNPKMQEGMMAQLRSTYDAIQEAIKKEATLIKKQTDIWWNDLAPGQQQSRKGGFEKMLSQLGLQEDQVKRANQLIGAGQASERVADKLAVKQMQIRLQMQETYYRRMRQIGAERIAQLRAAGKYEDAEHLQKSLNLALSEEQKKLDEQRVAIANQLEESQNRLYRSLKEWGNLLAGGVQSVMEASNAGLPEYYNERAKLNLTGKGGPGAGTYVVIENEGTSEASAHYEYLDERAALERQLEIERQNAQAEAWEKLWDDLNMKMSEQITDWMNAALQNQSVDMNTDATLANTEAIVGLTEAIAGGSNGIAAYGTGGTGGAVVQNEALSPAQVQEWTDALSTEPWMMWEQAGVSAAREVSQATAESNQKIRTSTQSTFAAMVQACNMYGLAYQAMSNDNLDTTQKFQMFALQAAGQAAIGMLTTNMVMTDAQGKIELPGILGKAASQLGPIAGPIAFAAMTALLGGLMAVAMSKVTKAKSQIAQVTGAGSAGAGRLATGMLTYAEGNVNEFTDPSTLTPGRSYNVDAADGRTYRAKYTGRNPRTHLTSGPEFHLSGEKGRELIIDAGTTRQITMNDSEVWHAIQTLSAGRRPLRRRHAGRGVAAFADGNIEDFEELAGSAGTDAYGMDGSQMAAFQSSLEKNNELLERALTEGIRGVFNVHGPEGLVSSYDKGKREALRHGERYP